MGFFVVLVIIILIFVIYKMVKNRSRGTSDGNEIKWERIELKFEDSDKTEGKYLVFDTETTGLPIRKNDMPENVDNWPYIVQLAWILFDDEGKEIEGKEYILKQKVDIPPNASKIHGITNAIMKEKGVNPQNVMTEFLIAVKRAKTIVAHNIDFDLPIIEAEFIRNGYGRQLRKVNKVCTMKVGTNFCKLPGAYGDYKYPTLMELFKKCFYDDAPSFHHLYDKHDAMTDVLITAKCFFKLRELDKIKK